MGKDLYSAVLKKLNVETIPVIKECFEEAIKTVRNNWASDLQRIYKSVVDDFYASYDPHTYDRNGSLKRVMVIIRDDNGNLSELDFDPSVMTYRSGYAGEDGLYNTVFKQGSHGGATGDHPNPETFWWRQPVPKYTRWYKEAEPSISPYDDMLGRSAKYFNKQASEVPNNIEYEMFRLLRERLS